MSEDLQMVLEMFKAWLATNPRKRVMEGAEPFFRGVPMRTLFTMMKEQSESRAGLGDQGRGQ